MMTLRFLVGGACSLGLLAHLGCSGEGTANLPNPALSTDAGGSGGAQLDGGAGRAGGRAGSGGIPGTGGSGGSGGSSGGPPCNPVGHDEDLDAVDDACDNCPTYSNPGRQNSDGDDLGDVCEAEGLPSLLSRLSRFDSWNGPVASSWDLGVFTLGTDALLIDTTQCTGSCPELAVWRQPTTGAFSVEASFRYETSVSGFAGVAFGVSGSPQDKFYSCEFDGKSIQIWSYTSLSPQGLSFGRTVSAATDPTTIRRMRVFWNPDEGLACSYEESGAILGVDAAGAGALGGQLEGSTGVVGDKASVRFDSFVLYE